mgnify:CR=1 FL=1
MSKTYLASFDIGKKNFAFVIEEVSMTKVKKLKKIDKKLRYNKDGSPTKEFEKELKKLVKCGKIILVRNLDLTKDCNPKVTLDDHTYVNMLDVLDEYKSYWDKCGHIIIEKQMSFRGKYNVMAMKLGAFCFSYFKIYYRETKNIVDYPAFHKTQVLGAIKAEVKQKYKRKKWAVAKATEILQLRKDNEHLKEIEDKKKRDDMSDCLLMTITYTYLKFVDNMYKQKIIPT